jgi:hypothetical protein
MVQGIFIAIETRVTSEAIWLAGVTYIMLYLSMLYSVVLGGLLYPFPATHTDVLSGRLALHTDLLLWFLL